jgi:hypothetical protein
MKLTSLGLKNFKSLVEMPAISLKPLTILVGPNSSGKTSLIRWLLALCQTARSRSAEIPLLTTGPQVQLGPFADYVSFHDRARRLSFSITVEYQEIPDYLRTEYVMRGSEATPPAAPGQITTSVTLGYNQKRQQLLLVEAHFEVRLDNGMMADIRLKRSARGAYPLSAHYGDVAWACRNSTPMNCLSAVPTLASAQDYRDNVGWYKLLFWIFKCSEQTLSSMVHLGPLREEARRHYFATGEAPADVGPRGEDSMSVLWLERHKPKAERSGLLHWVDTWTKQLGVAIDTRLKPIGSGLYNLEVRDPQLGTWANLVDVGFGVSQALPIIIQVFYSPPDSILILEQPEIHLHPRAQASMGDLLIEGSHTRTLVVETHSEHIISRIRRRIAEGNLRTEDVAIYNFAPTPDGTRVSKVELNGFGQFDPSTWPPGFFQENVQESKMHYEAIIRRETDATDVSRED